MVVLVNVITPQGLEPLQFPPKFRSPSEADPTAFNQLWRSKQLVYIMYNTLVDRGFGLTGTFYTSGNEREPLERKESDMTKKRHTPEQIVTLVRQVEVAVANGKGTPQACKEAAITEQTYYRWRKEYGGLKLAQAKRLKELEKENSRLKRVVAELSLEKQILREVAQGNS